MRVEQRVLGYPIRAQITGLDEGWDVELVGGCRTHVGAVTLAEPDGSQETLERPGHRDSHVSRRWAIRLARALGAPVCVRCGIHYDHASPEQVRAIVAACDQLLETVIGSMTGGMPNGRD